MIALLKPIIRRWLHFIFVGVLVGVLREIPPSKYFDSPLRRYQKCSNSIWQNIAVRNGISHVWTFDESTPVDIVSGKEVLFPGTEYAEGRFGGCRVFDGDDRTFVATSLRWSALGDAFTITMWFKATPGTTTQDILWSGANGFRLEDGRVCFDLLESVSVRTLSHPLPAYDRFIHLAAAVDVRAGKASLFIDGVEVAATSIAEPPNFGKTFLMFSRASWYKGRFPLDGAVDETVIWSRVLGQDEIKALARGSKSVLQTYASVSKRARLNLSRTWVRFAAAVGRAVHFDPMRALSWPVDKSVASLPVVDLVLSKADQRHLKREHLRSRESGRRTNLGAKRRSIAVISDGKPSVAALCLLGSTIDYAQSGRPAYHLTSREEVSSLSLANIVLIPPESGGWLDAIVLAELRRKAGLAYSATGLCQLKINGRPQGVYLFADYSEQGVPIGEYTTAADGFANANHVNSGPLFARALSPARRLSTSDRALPQTTDERMEKYDAVAAQFARAVVNDRQSPASRRVVKSILAEERRTLEEKWPSMPDGWGALRRAGALLDEFYVLGDNISPDRIVGALDIGAVSKLPGGISVAWASGSPVVLDDNGTPRRPLDGGPQGAIMVATLSDGERELTKELRFRIMPADIKLPTISIHVDQKVNKGYRVDAAIDYYAPGMETSPVRLLAGQGSRGGVSHRGNTGFFARKRMLSIKTDTPHGFFGDTVRRNAKSINALQDRSLICNALAFELFRNFKTTGSIHAAPEIIHAEAYVNGRYFGLLELATRIDEYLLPGALSGGESDDKVGSERPGLLLFRSMSVSPREPEMHVVRPKGGQSKSGRKYAELVQFMTRPVSTEWIAAVPENVDLTNMADFLLLLTLFGNYNGYPFPYWFHEYLAQDSKTGRYFYIPWDFDVVFRKKPSEFMANRSQLRLIADYPGYRPLLVERWSKLRSGPLSVENVLATANRVEARIAGYVEWDWVRWNPEAPFDGEKNSKNLIDSIPVFFEQMDSLVESLEN